jgi:hypothetical protein
MGRSDTRRTVRPHFLLVRLAVPPRAPVFVSPHKPDAGLGPGALRLGSPHAKVYRDGVAGSPRFPGNPDAPMPCSPTPAGANTPRRDGVSTIAPAVSTTKAPTGSTLGAQSHGFGAGCLRFAPTIAGKDARLASGGWLDLAGPDWLPAGLLREVSSMHSLHPFPSPELFLAQGHHTYLCDS